MARFRRDRNRIEADQTRVLSHPVRLSIMGLYTKDEDRSLRADGLLADLMAEDPDAFGELSEGQILYHRARLQDAQLLPMG